jgi:hypothetical protein
LPDITIDAHADGLKNNLSFSFRYFDNTQLNGNVLQAVTKEQLVKIIEKLKHLSSNTIAHWLQQYTGLTIYNDFPRNSDFSHPTFVPLEVLWARFRLENNVRLCGFLLPTEKVRIHDLQKNVFYVVFIDLDHKFYKPN